jgi:hypothetical protein
MSMLAESRSKFEANFGVHPKAPGNYSVDRKVINK